MQKSYPDADKQNLENGGSDKKRKLDSFTSTQNGKHDATEEKPENKENSTN